jgi:hypothetical protein
LLFTATTVVFPFPFALESLTHPLPLLARCRVQNAVKEKISLAKGDSGNDRISQIRWELDDLRNQQSDSKLNRGKVIDQLKVLQEGIQKRVRHVFYLRLSGF